MESCAATVKTSLLSLCCSPTFMLKANPERPADTAVRVCQASFVKTLNPRLDTVSIHKDLTQRRENIR